MSDFWADFSGTPPKEANPQGKPKSSLDMAKEALTRHIANIGEGALHGLPDLVGFLGDLGIDASEVVRSGLFPGMTVNGRKPNLNIPGAGPASQAVVESFNKAEEEYTGGKTPRIQTGVGKYTNAASRGVADMITGGGKPSIGAVTGGVGMGVAGQAAADLFPDSPLAQAVAAFGGAVAGHAIPHGISGVHGRMALNEIKSDPDYQHVVNYVIPDLESNFNPDAVNKKTGARGEMQVMPDTARDPGYGIRPSDGSKAGDIRVAKDKYAVLLRMFGGDHEKALSAYNWGEGNVKKAVDKYGDNYFYHMPKETQDYVSTGMIKAFGGPRPVSAPGEGVRPVDVNEAMGSEEPDWTNPNLFDNENYIDSADHSIPVDEPSNVADMDFERNKRRYKNIVETTQNNWEEENVPSLRESLHDFIQRGLDELNNSPDHVALRDINKQWEDALTDLKSGELTPEAYDARIKPLQAAHSAILKRMDDSHAEYIRNRDTAAQEHDASVDFNPKDNVGYEKHTPYVGEPKTPANTQEGSPVRHWADYTDNEWKQLTPKEKREALDFQIERDTNPPAGSSTFGTRKPEGSNRPKPTKGPEGHEPPRLTPNRTKVLDKLADALEQGKPIRREAEESIRKERSRRIRAAIEARKTEGGEAGFYKELAALKGEMGRPKIESIRHWFTDEEINHMYDIIHDAPKLNAFESIKAQSALNKLLGHEYGEIPTPKEIELLVKAMPEKAKMWRSMLPAASSTFGTTGGPRGPGRITRGPEGHDEPLPPGMSISPSGEIALEEPSLEVKKPLDKRALAVNIAGLPRTLKASFDFSAPFRQGMFLIGRKEFWKAFPDMFKSFFSEGHFDKVQSEIFNRPTYDLMVKAGLQTTRNDKGLMEREEAFISQFAEHIPGVRHSERAYIAFLNKLRADVFDDFVRKGEKLGIDYLHDPSYLKSAAKFINAATGRGDIKVISKNAQLLGNVLFSPRLMASRLQLLNPLPTKTGGFYANLHPAVRMEAAKNGLIYASTVMSILGLAAAGGATVVWDPRSTDFAKIKVGNTRFDVTGGFQPYVRFYAQFLTGQQKSIKDGKVRNIGYSPLQMIKSLHGHKQGPFKPTTRKDLVYNFLENKESPNASEVTRLLRGTDPVGNKLTVQSEAVNMFSPLILSDTYQAYKDLGAKGLLTVVPNTFGVGVQTYTPKPKKGDHKKAISAAEKAFQ